jgi:predicted ATPase
VAAFAFELAGDRERVEPLIEEGVARVVERGTPAVVVQQAFLAGLVTAIRGDAAATREWVERAFGPEGGKSVPHFTSGARVLRGWANALLDRSEAWCDESEAGLAELDAGVTTIAVPMLRSLHGEALLAVGRVADAVPVLERARSDAEAEGETWWLPETLRLLAEARRRCGAGREEVDGLLDRALALAESQGEPGLAERVKRSLASGGEG